jgi:hypothetical protein
LKALRYRISLMDGRSAVCHISGRRALPGIPESMALGAVGDKGDTKNPTFRLETLRTRGERVSGIPIFQLEYFDQPGPKGS